MFIERIYIFFKASMSFAMTLAGDQNTILLAWSRVTQNVPLL